MRCLTLDDPVVVGKEPIALGDRTLGYKTSANYGHAIAYGYLSTEHSEKARKWP